MPRLLRQGRQRARGHVAHRGKVSGVGRVVNGKCAGSAGLPNTAPVDDSAAPGAVYVVTQRWSQPTLPCAVSPSKPVRASESASRSARRQTGAGSDLHAVQVQRPANCCTSLGIDPPKAPKCSFAIPPGGTKKSTAPLQTPCKGVPRRCRCGRADVHHQVGGVPSAMFQAKALRVMGSSPLQSSLEGVSQMDSIQRGS